MKEIVKPINDKYTEAQILMCLNVLHDAQKKCGYTSSVKGIQYDFIHALTMMLGVARLALENEGENPDKIITDMMNSNTDILKQFIEAEKSGFFDKS